MCQNLIGTQGGVKTCLPDILHQEVPVGFEEIHQVFILRNLNEKKVAGNESFIVYLKSDLGLINPSAQKGCEDEDK